MVNWFSAASWVVERLPLERIFVPERDRTRDMQELMSILQTAPKVEVKPNAATTSKVSTKETVDYQNREIAKVLIQIERHAAQGLKINGRSCDCLSKHTADLEALAEETITMVSNPDIYYKIIDWVRDISPRVTPEANDSGLYTAEYPIYARQARDFRKELLGSLDYKALFNTTPKFQDMPKETRAAITEMVHKAAVQIKANQELEVPPELAREPVTKTTANIPENIPASVKAESDTEPETPITANGTICADLKSMVDWVAGEDEEKCRECMLTITIPWYFEELEEHGHKDLVEDLEKIQKEGNPAKVAAALDQVKEQVGPEVRQRLLEFDCATQNFENAAIA